MGKGEKQKAGALAEQQAAIGKEAWGMSKPLLGAGAGYLQDVMKGGPSAERAFGPSLSAAANQYSSARSAIESQYPPGGARDTAIRNLSVQEAGAKTGIMSSGFADAAYRSLAAGYQGAGIGVGAAGQAADIFGNIGSASQSNWTQGAVGAGTIAAMIAIAV